MPIFIFFLVFNFGLATPTVNELRFSNVTLLDFDEQALSIEDLHRTHGLQCDENQCQQKWACPINAECINKCAKYVCQCKEGFFKDGQLCVPAAKCDSDQCLASPCPTESRCLNRCDGFECLCEKGKWNSEVEKCELQCPEDKEEINGECVYKCEKTKCNCEANEICLRAIDFRKCSVKKCRCRKGFSRRGENNQCEKDCPSGYKLQGKLCKKICSENAATCSCRQNETCSTLIDENSCQVAQCSCKEGFESRDGKCSKICSEEKCSETKCGLNSVCEETCAGVICGCMPGYKKEGGICVRTYAKDYVEANFTYHLETPNTEQYSAVYGDPHFHIKGEQNDLCFDLQLKMESVVLLSDLFTGLTVTAELDNEREFFDAFIFEFNGADLRIGKVRNCQDSWKISETDSDPFFDEETGIVWYEEIGIGEVKKSPKFYIFNVVLDEIKFEISIGYKNKDLNLRVLEVGSKPRLFTGLIGDLMRPGSYSIVKITDRLGVFKFNEKSTIVSYKTRHQRNHDCWLIPAKDADSILLEDWK